MTQGDEARAAHEDVEPQGRDGRYPDEVHHVEQIGGGDPGHEDEERRQPHGGPQPPEVRLEDGQFLPVPDFEVPAGAKAQYFHFLPFNQTNDVPRLFKNAWMQGCSNRQKLRSFEVRKL